MPGQEGVCDGGKSVRARAGLWHRVDLTDFDARCEHGGLLPCVGRVMVGLSHRRQPFLDWFSCGSRVPARVPWKMIPAVRIRAEPATDGVLRVMQPGGTSLESPGRYSQSMRSRQSIPMKSFAPPSIDVWPPKQIHLRKRFD
jgi:hypothetical protein